MNREAIFEALFACTEGLEWNVGSEASPKMEHFKTRTRRIVLFSDVPDKDQPWFGQAEHGESISKGTRTPYKRILSVNWMVYHTAGKQKTTVPTIRNNLILDALERALAPKTTDPGFLDQRNTLSGLCYACYIDGEVFKDPGDIDGQALLVVPIKILVP